MENYKFSTLEYKRPDLETRRAKLAQWKAAVGQAESYEALRSLIFEIDHESCELFTQYSIAHIRHTLDTRDEFYEAEINYSQNSFFCKSMETKYCLPNSRSMSARKGLAAIASLSATSSPLSVGSVSCK